MRKKVDYLLSYFSGKITKKKSTISSAAALYLASCGSNDENQVISIEENSTDSVNTANTNQIETTNNDPNSFSLIAKEINYGSKEFKDVVTANSDTFVAGTSLIDENPYDDDELTVNATADITDSPTVSGIEFITFATSASTLGGDTEFDINLLNISGYNSLNFVNNDTNSPVKTIDLQNVGSTLSIGSHYTIAKLAAIANADIILSIANDIILNTSGSSKDLTINGNGNSVNLQTSTTTGNVTVSNADTVDITTISASENLSVVANGSVSLNNGSLLKGNIDIRSGGTITISDASSATGTLNLSNERASEGSDIVLTNVSSSGHVSINSVGSITATANNGLAAAKFISATASENSSIYADGVADQTISLNAANTAGATTQFTLNASDLEQLMIGGSSPIVVILDGMDISTESVTNTNSDATLWMSGGSSDLTQVHTSVKLRLLNHDGSTLTIKDGQDFYLDAEVAQTSSTAKPTFDHQTNATSSTTNAISIKTTDSNSSNSDNIANVAGLNFIDIQTINLQLLNDIGLNSSADIIGEDLKSLVVTGSGSFDLSTNTITGSSSTRVTLDASNAEGSITLSLDSTANGVANIQTGSAADTIKIDGITSDSAGFVINSGGSADTINVTTAGDGTTAKINLNGGGGSDILTLDAGVDLSASTLTLTSIEKLKIAGGGVSPKVAASDVSGVSLEIFESGAGTGILTVTVDQTTVNLSTFTFDSSFAIGTDSIAVDASGSSAGVNVTGTSGNDTITGSNADDTLTGGDAADIISGGTGDDTIVGGNGADTMSGGAGDDEFDFTSGTSTETSMDKINDYQADVAGNHNDTIDNITGSVGTNTSSIDVKSAISGGSGSVTASVVNGIVTVSGTHAGSIDTLAEWIDVVSVDGVIAAAADDADAVGTVAFQFNSNTYLVESNDTFNNNTPNVDIVSVIELTGLTSISAVKSDAAAAASILIA